MPQVKYSSPEEAREAQRKRNRENMALKRQASRPAQESFSMKRLRHRLRGLEIRRDLLSKSVEYDGISEDMAACDRQLQEVRELLQQAA